ncbi:hypothetical protein [Vibrio phage vB_VibM_10AMN]|uniref:Uncharacterized protein n=1 Tax=Staphylococcus phage vB_VibM_10AMN12 TaxID=3076785 RepID=A0AA96KTJ1_9CAUD|nr:hypothetical protein [Vibrio phage vB_VibM_10AMN]WNO47535.1 hypothetical protein [Staphylococcus phage vB_VibM_10AMN12]
MLNHDTFTRIVDKINDQYGTEHYLPAEYIWQDYVHHVKAFGKIVWDSDSCDATSESTIYYLCDRYIQKYILVNIWKQQVECMKDEIIWKLNDEGLDKELVSKFEVYFENELAMLEEK